MYIPGRGVAAATMTPYDIAAVRLAGGIDLAGTPPPDADRYLDALRADRTARACALTATGEIVTAADVVELVERLAGLPWAETQGRARAAGALLGAYPAEG